MARVLVLRTFSNSPSWCRQYSWISVISSAGNSVVGRNDPTDNCSQRLEPRRRFLSLLPTTSQLTMNFRPSCHWSKCRTDSSSALFLSRNWVSPSFQSVRWRRKTPLAGSGSGSTTDDEDEDEEDDDDDDDDEPGTSRSGCDRATKSGMENFLLHRIVNSAMT